MYQTESSGSTAVQGIGYLRKGRQTGVVGRSELIGPKIHLIEVGLAETDEPDGNTAVMKMADAQEITGFVVHGGQIAVFRQ